MKVLNVRNVHEALPRAVQLIHLVGDRRPSRYGEVLQYPGPVSTVYERPRERVLFWPERDANPFLHLYESLWMLAGRNDVAGPVRYAKRMQEFSDDGETYHGAYGHRWRRYFGRMVASEDPNDECDGCQRTVTSWESKDQLAVIADLLGHDSTDRRAVLQMWDAEADLGRKGKDLPCNTMATFQINRFGHLDLVVFCRSNDIVWGAYGANAVQFSMLLEYMSRWIGVPMGTYTQISVNWHAYLKTLEPVLDLRDKADQANPYQFPDYVRTLEMPEDIELIDSDIDRILTAADNDFPDTEDSGHFPESTWGAQIYRVLFAHSIWKTEGRESALRLLYGQTLDWAVAAREWLERRSK